MSRSTASRWLPRSVVPASAGAFLPSGPRLLAVGAGLLLMGSYLGVFYHVVDVVGGVRWFALGVGTSLVAATAVARLASVRSGLVVGGLLFAGGVGAYVLLVPSLHGELFTIEFVEQWLSYLAGVSVLEFRRVDLWAVAVAPGPAFLSWLLLLIRRYDAAAIVGGLLLGFFALTGDAGATTSLVGATSLLAMLGLGTVEREAGTLRELTRIGFVLALAVVVARSITLVPEAGGRSTTGSGGGGGDSLPLAGDLQNADEQARIHESISLSPRVFFTIAATEEADWRVAAYDRYTGDDWIRTGGSTTYDGPLSSPPGAVTRLDQTVRVERAVRTLPAAWKPIEVSGLAEDDVLVTDHEGLAAARSFDAAETYRVRSDVPDVTADVLREAGREYPDSIRERYLQLPESTPQRVRELATEIAGDAPGPYEAAILLRRWLTSQKRYELAVDRPPGDVVDAFLFGMEEGYCVYFASAMAVMLRTIGVPARFVLGYTSGQPIEEDRWVVRGLDSHAWVEVFFPGRGWVGFDPTPSVDRRDVRIDFLEAARRDDVDGVDTDASRTVSATAIDAGVESIGGNVTDAANATSRTDTSPITPSSSGSNASAAGQLRERGGESSPAAGADGGGVATWLEGRDRIALLAGAAGVGIGLHWLGAFERGYRTVRLRWQQPTDSPRRDVERAYERLELLLAGRYRDRAAGETRRRYLAAAGETPGSRRVRRLLDLYERARYGGGVTRAEADEAIRLADALVAEDR